MKMSSFSDAPMFFKEDAEVMVPNIIDRYTALCMNISCDYSGTWICRISGRVVDLDEKVSKLQ